MASYSYVFPVHCPENRPLVSHNFNQFKALLSSSVKPRVKEFPQIPNLSDVPKMIKATSVKLLDKFVDLAFEFEDEQLLPSQSNFAPVEEIGEAVPVVAVEGNIPNDFPDGIYIRNVFGKTSSVWVEDEGMAHALNFKKGSNGSWNTLYKNKYLQTESLKSEIERNRPTYIPAIEGNSQAVIAALLLNLGEEFTKVEYHKFPENTFCSGATFVPKPGGLEEDDGWIISFVHNEDTNTSQAYIVDAKKFSSEPVAKIGLPNRVPYGFHGIFSPTVRIGKL